MRVRAHRAHFDQYSCGSERGASCGDRCRGERRGFRVRERDGLVEHGPSTLARTSGRAAGGRATGGVWAASYRLRLDSNPFARATWVVDDYSRMFSRVNGAIHEESVAPICQLKKRLQYQSLVPLFYFWLVGTRRFNSSLQLKTMLIWVGATSPISLDLSIKKRWPSRETS